MHCNWWITAVGLLFLEIAYVCCVPLNTQSQAATNRNTVKVTFYLMSTGQWEDKQQHFSSQLTTSLNDLCSETPGECGLVDWETSFVFEEQQVGYSDDTPTREKHLLSIHVFMAYSPAVPDSSKQNNKNYVTTSALLKVLKLERELLNDAGYNVVGIGGEKFAPRPDDKMDIIMIPISFGILLIVIIIAICCCCYRQQMDKREARDKRIQAKLERIRQSRRQPVNKGARPLSKSEMKHQMANARKSQVSPTRADTMKQQVDWRPQSQNASSMDYVDHGDTESVVVPDVSQRPHKVPPPGDHSVHHNTQHVPVTSQDGVNPAELAGGREKKKRRSHHRRKIKYDEENSDNNGQQTNIFVVSQSSLNGNENTVNRSSTGQTNSTTITTLL